jgi:hypothetical protein
MDHLYIMMNLSEASFLVDVPLSLVLCPSDRDSRGTVRCSPRQPNRQFRRLPPAVPSQRPQIWPPDDYNHRHMLAAFGQDWPRV